MNEQIAGLIELQEIDDEIRGFALSRDELAGNLERLRNILAQMGGALADKREKLAEAQRFHDEKRIDLQADSERMMTAKSKLAGVTRTKEYAAMQRELDNLRKQFSDDEAELKRLAEAIAEYKTAIASEEAKLEELSSEVAREEASSAGRLAELNKTIDTIAARKKTIVAALPHALVSRYNRLLDRRDGKAVVLAAGGHCSGCRMMIPPQRFISIQRGETLHSCSSCQRFLYYTQEAAAAAASA